MKKVAHKESGFSSILVLVVMLFAIVGVFGLVLTQTKESSGPKGTGTPPPLPTSTNPPATVTVPLSESVMAGYIGCSMTRDAVNGYHTVGGTQMWERIDYSAGVVTAWQVSGKQPVANNT